VNPVLTIEEGKILQSAKAAGTSSASCSLDLGRTESAISIDATHWQIDGSRFPYPTALKDRTIYFWNGAEFELASRFSGSLIKLVPTEWGAPTFEIDGIKMLPTAKVSPYEDAKEKVRLIQPRGKTILDTCGGLGYFAAWCLQDQAAQILSYEINPDVIWLRGINPWSPQVGGALSLAQADIATEIAGIADNSIDAILHDPPRFGIAGDLYSQNFYDHLGRVLKRRGKLFHYTGTPNKLTTGRDVPGEVSKRLERAGFSVKRVMDGVVGVRA
jgi:uncharacterized protein